MRRTGYVATVPNGNQAKSIQQAGRAAVVRVEYLKNNAGLILPNTGIRKIDYDRARIRIENQAAEEGWTPWQLKMALTDVRDGYIESHASSGNQGMPECIVVMESPSIKSECRVGMRVPVTIRDADVWNRLYSLIDDNDDREMLPLVSPDGQRCVFVRRNATVYFVGDYTVSMELIRKAPNAQ